MFQKSYKNFETKKVKSNDSSFSINSYFSQPCLGHSRGNNFTHPILVPALIPIFDQRIVWRPVTRLGHSIRDIHHPFRAQPFLSIHFLSPFFITYLSLLPSRKECIQMRKNISLSFDADVLFYPVWQ